ncbi:hypothetical protein B0H17DRAFT_1196772 [Mycena rosella]|uniref:Uncharacterized protein n=1 Tax=Mycena rosella TaxID=1033263 RepID=A0AAD7DTJ7_MYCRO|nr:hypothetical protein B0H17DRAFT_1196772 [Mycena rosella]
MSPPAQTSLALGLYLTRSRRTSSESFLPNYLGNDTSTVPEAMINYLAGIRARTGDASVRIRVGGNSAGSSIYVEDQTVPMAVLIDPYANPDDQSVNYGPEIWATLVAQLAGGVEYLIDDPLRDPNNTNPKIDTPK